MARQWTAAQSAAMNTRGRLMLVSAAAGSGKTATLTERIIRRLTDKENPAELSRLLVVTFTRAAAAELRTRISDALSEAIAADPGNRHLQKQLLDLSGAHISTIDSFCMDMVKSHFARLGLPAGFRIADDAELNPLSERVMDELIDRFYKKYAGRSDAGGRFSLLAGNDFADLCDALCHGRTDDDLPGTLRGLYTKLLDYPVGIERLRLEAETLRNEADGEFLHSSFGKLLYEWKQLLASSAKAFFEDALAQTAANPDAQKAYDKALVPDADFVSALYAEDTYEGLRSLFADRVKVTIGTLRKGGEAFALMREKRKWYNAKLDKFRDEYLTDDVETIRRDMLRSARMCEVLYDFLSAYDARMSAEKRQRGICDFTDNRRNLLSLLQNPDGSPSPLSAEMRDAFDEVYIDEYQDVDEVQDTIFRLVGGDHRFMVGDIKQSIYGFRGADPGVFASYRKRFSQLDPAASETFPDDAEGCCVFMSDNFRCDEPVIRTANSICGHLFRSCPGSVDYQPEDDLGFAKSVPETAVRHKVQLDVLFSEGRGGSDDEDTKGRDERDELLHTANRIADILRGGDVLDNGEPVKPEDIAVLVRTNTSIPKLIAVLREMGIPAGSGELDAQSASLDLLTGPDMTYLVDLLRVFDNPDTDGPLSEVMRAPFPGFSLDDLITVRACGRGSLYDGLLSCSVSDTELSARAKEFADWLENYRRMCMTLPCGSILRAMKRDKRVACRDSRAFLYLYDSVRAGRAGRFTGIYDFLRYFEKKIESGKGAGGDAKTLRPGFVSVMTIHASKGLEFPIVFLIRTGSAFSYGDRIGDLVFTKRVGAAMRLFDRAGGRRYTPLLHTLASHESRVLSREDDMRVLYVAMTRARERLYISGVSGKTEPLPFASSDRFAALEGTSFLSWMRSAAMEHPEMQDFCDSHSFMAADVVPGERLDLSAAGTSAAVDVPARDYYRALADRMPAVTTGEALLRSIPTKVPASRMSDRLLDECVFISSDLPLGDEYKLSGDETGFGVCDAVSGESVARSISLMEKAGADELEFALRENRKPTAAEKGTAAHAFLQYCDYARVRRDGIEAETARLVDDGYLDARTASIADRTMLRRFFDSRFFEDVAGAVTVRREFRFARFVPLCELTENDEIRQAVGGRTLYVQGSVDLLLTYADGRITLCDYKTDRVTKEERADLSLLTSHLTERHGAQLRQYADAIREVFGRAPDRVCIFSLPLGEAVEIEV